MINHNEKQLVFCYDVSWWKTFFLTHVEMHDCAIPGNVFHYDLSWACFDVIQKNIVFRDTHFVLQKLFLDIFIEVIMEFS